MLTAASHISGPELSADRLALVQAGVSREAIVAALGEPQRTRRLRRGEVLRYREVEALRACRVYLLCFIPLGSTQRTTTLDLRLEDDRLVSATMKRSGSGPNSRTVIVSPETPDDACAVLPIFEIYRQQGAMSRSARTLDFELPVDLHAADCGAMDCYGHQLELRLEIEPVGHRCEIRRAAVTGRPWDRCKPAVQPNLEPWTSTLQTIDSPDLAAADLARIELRDPGRREALLLLPSIYYAYEDVGRDAILLPELDAGDDPRCCFGYSSSWARFWTSSPEGFEKR